MIPDQSSGQRPTAADEAARLLPVESACPPGRALVLGASGGIGGELARQMRDAGWAVQALNRRAPVAGEYRDGLHWIRGDAMNASDVLRAAAGCELLVHAVNPPGYRRWAELVMPMLENSLAAATAQQAMLVLPGTVYNYGPDAPVLLAEDAPQHAHTRKGMIRVEMESRLKQFSDAGGRALIVRAGDYFGPSAANNWFAQALIKPGRPVRTVRNPGQAGVGHQWAYLPDVAVAMLALLDRRNSLDRFARFHLAGHWDADGQQMVESICRVVARQSGRRPRRAGFPWWLTALAAPVVTTFREMQEVRYLWHEPVRLDNARLLARLGHEPHTPLDAAVQATLEGLACLGASPSGRHDDNSDSAASGSVA